jgi:predicted HTH transcriptional regulator
MTKREFLTKVSTGEMNDEVMEFAAAEIAKMDAANDKRKEKTSKKAEENQPLVDRIVNEILGDEPVTATDVAGILEVSVQKASQLCRAAVAQGMASSQDVKIPKKGNMKGYTKA